MFLDKAGLYRPMEKDLHIRQFKPYVYKESLEKFPIVSFYSDQVIIIRNGVLYIKDKEYDLSKLLISEVLSLFTLEGFTINFPEELSIIESLPALLLSNTSNAVYNTVIGDRSPIPISSLYRPDEVLSHIKVIENNTYKQYTKINDNMYYKPSKATKIFVTSLKTNFELTIDFGPKFVETLSSIGYLLEQGANNES